ncbi:polyprenyl synthetase family protein [Paenibacillus radicis (ex Gao et al. 2016)]|uniref:Heptaprenyl diphosphate synthase component II n=1 Tax=Paenibacillus radicis (ex Gao et al. 2016) TaxID=1737354 RepID=A0A917GV22_9BACL|nr:polyprenyl synthetase family protein [Paenibacillus radicis (ex Gao et al. 2016)]GGG57678.1 heptaprenyl diphosphate synthase component II [Paenibacillus radicis (ex Gao et al. 2016)]
MKLLDIFAKLKGDINQIERELERSVTFDDELLSEASLHLLKAGGKRLRPVFVLLSGKFGHYNLDVLKKIAVPLELIHMSSLVHDDVIDDAATRRGQQTVKSKWDNRVAMYTGDYIFGKALTIATELNNPFIHQMLSKALVQMSIGEMEQIRDFFNTKQSIRNYLLRIRRKTALLIAISCQLGAAAADADRQTVNRLYRYGYNVGMAYQIRDDLLDLFGTEKQIGKPPGSDIRQGNITLPVILALKDDNVRDPLLKEIDNIMKSNGTADTSAAIKMIKASSGIELADRLANRYIEKALHALEGLPSIGAKKNLIDIAYFTGKRNY